MDLAAAQASDFVGSYIEVMMAEMPHATVAEIRQAAIDAIGDTMYAFGDQAAELACELFDELAADAGSPKGAAIYDGLVDAAKVDKKVRYLARKLVTGDRDGFVKSIRDVTAYYVKRSAMENMVRNCQAQQVRYARVTTGLETCAFCFMLSSRGFVYHSEATALGTHGYHEHCNCVAVPGFADADEDRQIEGYKPRGMRDRFLMCAETIGVDGARTLDSEHRKKVLKEVETRDWKWLYSGTVPVVEYISDSVRGRVADHEKGTASRLSKNGLAVLFAQDYRVETSGNGVKRRVGLPDFADGTEIKTLLTSRNPLGAVDNYLNNASKKEGLKRVVIDNAVSEHISDDELVRAVRKVLPSYECIQSLYLVLKSGKYKKIR